ncbi:MAG: nucleotidyltransferase domain-containing protein [Clostridiales bacterium]|nr:nucleotidyltransferase domain-containing protein [Clostridiales bacterium]
MCDQIKLNKITSIVVQAARDSLGSRLDKVILYGSYARGDYNSESDIDIMVLADIPLDDRWQTYLKISKLTEWLDLEYDVLTSINVNLVQTVDEDGYVTIYEHDPRNLIEAVNYDGGNGKRATFGYNKAGQLVEMVDWNGTTEFVLDGLGRITEATDHGCNVTLYGYDEAGNRASTAYPDGTAASYEYDLLDRLVALVDAEGEVTAYSYDAARLTGMSYPNGWSESYSYNAKGWLTGQAATDPTNTPSKTVTHTHEYDVGSNIERETRSGAGGQDAFDRDHEYDALGRLVKTTAQTGQKDRNYDYFYDSLGNLVYEKNANGANKGNEYWHDSLNQQVRKVVDNKDEYLYSFDLRGNLVEGRYQGNGSNANRLEEQYAYDASNRMVKGTRYKGTSVAYEESHYVYNGFGDLVANEWIIAKNAYGYTGISTSPTEQVGGAVACDRHRHATGQGHQNPTGNGHTAGGTEGGAVPAIGGHQAVVHKDFAIDYASPLKNVMIELESGDDPNGEYLKYRHSYGLRKTSTAVIGFDILFHALGEGGGPDSGVAEYVVGEGGGLEFVSEESFSLNSVLQEHDYGTGEFNPAVMYILKLHHHQDRLGVTDYLTAAAAGGKVMGYVTYDDWGALTAKAVLNCRLRQLDLVQDYTGHPYDQVLAAYYAKARMYDAIDRRFMAVDPVKGSVSDPQSMVQYTYCLDNPVLYVDPLGLMEVLAKYVVEKNGGSISWNSKFDTVLVSMNGKDHTYNASKKINGRVVLDSADLALYHGVPESELLHNTRDAFNSVDDAAAAFLLMKMPETHTENREHGSYINRVWHDGKEYFYFPIFVCGGHNDVVGIAIVMYTNGNTNGYNNSVFIQIGGEKVMVYDPVSVAFVHTHPSCICHNGVQFSDQDMWMVDSSIFFGNLSSIYLGTTTGEMRVYDSSTTTKWGRKLSSNLPAATVVFPAPPPAYKKTDWRVIP